MLTKPSESVPAGERREAVNVKTTPEWAQNKSVPVLPR